MRRYWIGIAIGVVLIFALGLTAMAGVRKGKEKVRSVIAKAGGRIPAELADLPFRLDGEVLGDFSGVTVRKGGAGDVGDVVLRVRLRDGAGTASLAGCVLTGDRLRHFRRGDGFRCADAAELADGSLELLGTVTFEPDGLTRPLYASGRDLREWRRADIRSLEADLVRDSRGGVRAQGLFDIIDDHGERERGSFELIAGDGATRFDVRSHDGRELVHFDASEGGVSIRINDRKGKRLLRLLTE